jgi:hypothetical protein
VSSDDEELREAERTLRASGTLEARHAYARLLRRAGRIDELLALHLPEGPPELREIVRDLGARFTDRTLLVGTGQSPSTDGKDDRVGVLDVSGKPRLAWNGFVPRERVRALRDALAERNAIWPGELDFMFATRWTLAWTHAPAPLRVWDRRRERVALDGGTLRVRRTTLAASDLRSVDVWLANGWVTRGVSIVASSRAEPIVVARQRDLFASIDPTYDALNLGADASWAVALGRRLASALNVPCTIAKDLR